MHVYAQMTLGWWDRGQNNLIKIRYLNLGEEKWNLMIKGMEKKYTFKFPFFKSSETCHVHILSIENKQMCFSQSSQIGGRGSPQHFSPSYL